ncbi:MAG: hypothetical protein AABZ55_05850 [Bdellovibrionota bacterium]
MTAVISPDVLLPWGKTLLLASFSFCLIRSMRGLSDLHTAFERLAIGFLALLFFKDAGLLLNNLSQELSDHISNLGNQIDLKAIILEAFKKARVEPTAGGGSTVFNIPALLEQAWRTGVWGIMGAIVDWAFIIASFLLESAKDVLWSLLLFLFPLACGIYPLTPRLLTNLAIYAIELALWFPILSAVEAATGEVARHYMSKSGSLGLYVVAVELLAVILIFHIPTITHRFLSGAFAGDFDTQANLIQTAKKAAMIAKSWGMAR